MGVLVEAYSVIIRKDAIEQKFLGGYKGLLEKVPNETICDDGEIIRVGFMSSRDVHVYVSELEQSGLIFIKDEKAVDIALADQNNGVTTPCDWLQFLYIKSSDSENATIPVCLFFDGPKRDPDDTTLYIRGDSLTFPIAFPTDWKYEGSIVQSNQLTTAEQINDRYKYVRSEGTLQVYLDTETGREVYFGRVFDGE